MTDEDDRAETDEPPTPTDRPLLTGDVPNFGGELKAEPEDFVVDEIPAYRPDGEGPHYYLWVEKRDVDARRLLDVVSRRFEIPKRDLGTAGNKDRRAVTRQWVSVPAQQLDEGLEPNVETLEDGIEVLEVSRHRNKLRTGHLDGNRFSIRIRDTDRTGAELEEAMEETARRIDERGLANYYGLQRFGRDGSTLEAGWRWLVEGRAPGDHFLQKMAASALQSEIFNRVLIRRLEEGSWKTVVAGDIFKKTDTGGEFWIDESEREETQRRLDDREIVVTGPMPGSERGWADREAGRIEREVVESMGLAEEDFEQFGRRGKGTRRPMTIYLDDLDWEMEADDRVRLEFSLPSGSYATVLLREFIGTDPESGGETQQD